MAAVPLTPAVLQLLTAKRIFDTPPVGGARRWRVGEPLYVDAQLRLEPYTGFFTGHALPREMGAFSYTHSNMAHHALVGRYCSIGAALFWMGGEHPAGWATTSPISYDPSPLQSVHAFFQDIGEPYAHLDWPAEPWRIEIGHDVWIGDGVMLKPNLKIGHGAVVGARSLVLKDVPPYAIVAGAPARILRYRFPDPLIERMLALQWWRYTPDVVKAAEIKDPERFVEEFPAVVEARKAQPFAPAPLTLHDLAAAIRATAMESRTERPAGG